MVLVRCKNMSQGPTLINSVLTVIEVALKVGYPLGLRGLFRFP